MSYRKLEVNDKVKIINPGFNNHGAFGVVIDTCGHTAQVSYKLWESHRLTNAQDIFHFDNLLLSTGNPWYDGHGQLEETDEKLYEANLLERIVKLEQEVLDLKKQLA